MFEMYVFIASKFPERIYLIRVEGALENLEEEARRLAIFLEVEYEPAMLEFPIRMRNQKKERYGAVVDKTQIQIWKNWEAAYEGYFTGENGRIIGFFQIKEYYRIFRILITGKS